MTSTPPVKRPNIILILVDDMGFSDIGCYGSEIPTPNLDRMAANGVRFTHMYNGARCCPTRASLLTGLYPHQTGVGAMVGDNGLPGYRGFINDRCVTIAEVLRANGYQTFMSGKWHVGGPYTANTPHLWTPGAPGFPTPRQRGFDAYYGTLGGGGSYFDPPTLLDNDTIVHAQGDYYYTDAISQRAVSMIGTASREDAPFFLYVAYTAPHWPLHARHADIELFRGRYGCGWDAIRCRRHETLKGMGIVNPRWDISPRDPQSHPWQDDPEKEWQDLRMAVYAAQVHSMDRGVGFIFDALRRLGKDRDTLVFFLSDNGGCAEFVAEDTNKPDKFRYNIPTRDGRPMRIGNTPRIAPGPDDTFASYDLPWANASNSPFRRFKHYVHEGGISTPLIVHWPSGFAGGGMVHDPSHVIDLMPTCLQAAGAAYPREFNGQPITPLAGQSLLPALRGNPLNRPEPLFWEHEDNRAVRHGQWKIVSEHLGPWELYDMSQDRTETRDLAASEPARVRELAALYDAWAARVGVVPRAQLAAASPSRSH